MSYILVAHKTNEVESAGRWLSGTLSWPLWLRLSGMNIGTKCEISTIIGVIPECLSVGGESFFADGIYLNGAHIYCGTVTIKRTSLGRGTFLGNHVVIPGGAQLPEDLFVGVCTVANSKWSTPSTAWFGHPPMELPRREVVNSDRNLTHYLLHLCVVYVPQKILLGHEEWSVTNGLWAFAGYVSIAVPLSVLWFRSYHRGPAEATWAILSGQKS